MSDDASKIGPVPGLVVVVVNWNGRDLLDDCLGSLRGGYPDLRVIMVDNGSVDDSVAYCRERFPWVEIIESPENLRWAGGNNLALRNLCDEGWPDYVLLLNNDTMVPEGSLSRLVDSLEAEPEAWAATPRICFAAEPGRIWYDGGKVGQWSGWIAHRGIRVRAGHRPLEPHITDYATGCAMLLSRRALETIGLFDESFHLYAEDCDYSLRLRAAGGTILHQPKALVLHKVSRTVGAGSPAKAYLKARSHVRLMGRHWPRRTWPLLLPAQAALVAATAAWHLWLGRPATALASVTGVFDELAGRPVVNGSSGVTNS